MTSFRVGLVSAQTALARHREQRFSRATICPPGQATGAQTAQSSPAIGGLPCAGEGFRPSGRQGRDPFLAAASFQGDGTAFTMPDAKKANGSRVTAECTREQSAGGRGRFPPAGPRPMGRLLLLGKAALLWPGASVRCMPEPSARGQARPSSGGGAGHPLRRERRLRFLDAASYRLLACCPRPFFRRGGAFAVRRFVIRDASQSFHLRMPGASTPPVQSGRSHAVRAFS